MVDKFGGWFDPNELTSTKVGENPFLETLEKLGDEYTSEHLGKKPFDFKTMIKGRGSK
ncbi:MAG: hypothetical protein ACTSXQ_08010 [Alphaproteobacteria bacterium]